MFKYASIREKATLSHLKVLLNHNRVTFNKCKITDFNACDNFFKVIVSSHIIAAAMELLNMSNVDDEPANESVLSPDAWLQDDNARKDILYSISSKIVSTFTDIEAKFVVTSMPQDDDRVLQYSRLVMSIGLLYLEYCDAIKEGDGMRVLRCWRFMLLYFKCTGRTNYSIESFTMLAQYHFLFSQRQKQQLLWGRFINIHGLPAQNIPCDLFMEHLNRVCKEAVNGLGANKTPKGLDRIGKIVGTLDEVLRNFDKDNSISERSGKHKVASIKKDLNTVVKVLIDESVFKYSSGRYHPTFRNIKRNPIAHLDHESLLSWMYIQLNNLINGF